MNIHTMVVGDRLNIMRQKTKHAKQMAIFSCALAENEKSC